MYGTIQHMHTFYKIMTGISQHDNKKTTQNYSINKDLNAMHAVETWTKLSNKSTVNEYS